jgi:NAD kinase
MVFAARDRIRFKLLTPEQKSVLQLDGKNSSELEFNDEIIINSASRKIKFIKLSNNTFYQILRKKLHLGRI